MVLQAYLAGPDVFLPHPREHAQRKIAICARYGIVGRTPLNEDIERSSGMSDEAFAFAIFRKDVAMMQACDIMIANLTPFRGA
jgi:nucleoside 2-deoxyribosyltransferase